MEPGAFYTLDFHLFAERLDIKNVSGLRMLSGFLGLGVTGGGDGCITAMPIDTRLQLASTTSSVRHGRRYPLQWRRLRKKPP
jgi:hypothetical protein